MYLDTVSVEFVNFKVVMVPTFYKALLEGFLVPYLLNPGSEDVILDRNFALTLMGTESNLK